MKEAETKASYGGGGGGKRDEKGREGWTEKKVANRIEIGEVCDNGVGVKIESATDQEVVRNVCLKYEKELVGRLDKRLLPMLSALYSVALIDRLNMANAAVAGMTKDLELHIKGRYNIAIMIFFIPYLLFELPSNVILRRLGARRWLSGITFSWGIVMIGMGFVHDWKSLAACRAILGLLEAGLFPGCAYLIGSWYVRFEVQKRLAAFYLFSSLVSGISSLLASGIMQMDGLGGVAGWRWIFIIEGIITVVFSVLSYFIIIDFPDKVQKYNRRVFSNAEVEILKSRIRIDHGDTEEDPITLAKIGTHLCDVKIWLYAIMSACTSLPIAAVYYFQPIILEGMGHSPLMCQLLSAPPYAFACVIGFLCAALGDRIKKRGPIIAFSTIMCVVGLVLSAYSNNNGVRYLGAILWPVGCCSNFPAILSYQFNNIRTSSKRAVATALFVGSSGAAGIVASAVFRHEDAPRYLRGFIVTLVCQVVLLGAVVTMTILFRIANEKHRRGELKKPLEGHPDFTYTY